MPDQQERPEDPRIVAFCSPERPEVFHAVAYRNDIWKQDPFDVESIHEEARSVFQRLVNRAASPTGAAAGRILLLLGEAGSGKTHLMRAFRNWAHSRGRGYYGYMQMTSSTDHYGRYVLNNLVDSLDQPYHEPEGPTSGLMRLSTALAESSRDIPRVRIDQLREDDLDQACLTRLIEALADQIVVDDRFNDVDLDLIRALLYLQRDDPRTKARVLKYLRCESLSDADRAVLGGLEPRQYGGAPERVVERLGKLIWAVESVPLILCVDQLEDIYNVDEAPVKFRRVVATLCDLVSRVPSAVVVISCLADFYKALSASLTRPLVDRLESDPKPITLRSQRDEAEAVAIVAERLRFLDEALGAEFRDDDPTFPIPRAELAGRAGQRPRDILGWCQEYREACVAAGRLVPLEGAAVRVEARPAPAATTHLEQAWNDFRTSFAAEIPTGDEELAALLAGSIAACSREVEEGGRLEAEARGRMVVVEHHAPGAAADRLLVGVCNKSPRGGGLGAQVAEVTGLAGESGSTPVVVRSTEFPTNPRAEVVKQLGELISRGGRRAVIEDSDWRAMLAMKAFHDGHASDPDYAGWLRKERPLSLLKSLRSILDLDRTHPPRPRPDEAPARPDEPAGPGSAGDREQVPAPAADTGRAEGEAGPIVVGVTDDRSGQPVVLEPDELTRHAAFLGGSGSGKTTTAMTIVEQLLLRGVPAILVDRKGDLCGYAAEQAPESGPQETAERRRQLRDRVDVALYTPGNPGGRPLSIAIVPAGIGQLPTFEREQMARYAASALAGMMNYGAKGTDLSCLAVLASAINLLSQFEPDATVSLAELIRFVDDADPALVNAVGRLDTRLFKRLVQDLETLRLTRGDLLTAEGERLDAEALLGLGRHAIPGKTRLSVVSTKFLGGTQDVQFWVSQLLVELTRWSSRSPSGRLQAAVFFDEADLYLPALRQPPSKEPMENLLKRARSAGLGLLLATQSPGDFDYKCRDTIRSWFVGRIKEPTALAKLKPMLSECRVDVSAKLPAQGTGHFYLLRDGSVTSLRTSPCAVPPEQRPEDEIPGLARRSGAPAPI